jgi:hypothetical protein
MLSIITNDGTRYILYPSRDVMNHNAPICDMLALRLVLDEKMEISCISVRWDGSEKETL